MSITSNTVSTSSDEPQSRAAFSELWQYAKPHWLRMILILIAMAISASGTLVFGYGMQFLIDNDILSGDASRATMRSTAIAIVGLAIIMSISTTVRYYNISWLGERVVASIRQKVFAHLIYLDPNFFERQGSGELQAKLTADLTLIQSFVGSDVSILLRSLAMGLGGVLILFHLYTPFAYSVLGILLLIVLPMVYLGRMVRRISQTAQSEIASVGSYLNEVTRNIKTVQGFNREQHHVQGFDRTVEKAFAAGVRSSRVRAILTAIAILLLFCSLAMLITVGSRGIAAGDLTAGALVNATFVAVLVATSFGVVTESLAQLFRVSGAFDRVQGILDQQPMLRVNREHSGETEVKQSASVLPIVVSNLAFTYPLRPDIKVLDDFSLDLEAGSFTALVGRSGAGKSTLFDLIMHFYEFERGYIEIGGKDIQKMSLKELRATCGLVRQDTPLLSGSLRDNICYGCDFEVDDARLAKAVAAAGADDIIDALPDGYDTVLGEDGIGLSGGQRQRIALARTLICEPPVLLLDEITSNVAVDSEIIIHRALQNLKGRHTILMSTHRESAMRAAENVVVLREGQIIAQGPFEQVQDHIEANMLNQEDNSTEQV